MAERDRSAQNSRSDSCCAAFPRLPHAARLRGWLTRSFLLLVLAVAAMHAPPTFAQKLLDLPSLPLQGIGRVEAMVVQSDGKIIIGGAFGYVNAAGDARVNLARFNSNGTLDTTFNFKATSTVNALTIIGNTLYLGGDFTGLSKIGGASTLRNRLAAIDLSSLNITSFNPNVDGEVFALTSIGTTLYVGGAFTFVNGGTQRIGAAAYDTATAGTPLTGWDPEPRDANAPPPVFQGVVYALAPFSGGMYVGGTYTQIGGNNTSVARDNIAAVDTGSGLALAWAPTATNGGGTAIVRSIVATPSVVYLGGQFSGLSGFQRLGIGAVSAASGAATAWNPGMVSGFGTVRAMVLDGTTLYAGGEFTAMGGATRNHAAGIDTTVTSITALTRVSTTATAQVASTAALTNGGSITVAGATPNAYNGVQGPITIVDATHFTFPIGGSPTTPATGTITFAKNNNATAFNPNLDGDVHSMAVTSTAVLMGGTFLKANGLTNPGFGGFDKTSGALTIAGNVYDTAAVWSLVRQPDGKTIVAGDYFATISGVFYRGLLRLNANDTVDTSWNPVMDGQIVTAALGPIVPPATAPTTVLVGGSFAKVGGTAKARLAAVDLTSGLATSFNANVNSTVSKVIVDGTTAYIGGNFTSVGATARNFIAAVDATTGGLQSWYPAGGADDAVQALDVDGSNVYAGGYFFTIGGQTRLRIAKIAKAGAGVDAAWHPDADEAVFGVTVSGATVYVSGNFSHLGGGSRNFTGAVSASTGALLPFNPNPDFVVLKVTVPPTPPNTVYLSGAFLIVGGLQTGTAAAVDATSGAVKPWFPLTNDSVYDLVADATHVTVGGVFVVAGAVPRLSLAAFSNAGVPDPPTNVVASPGNGSASVTFSAPANNGGSAITGYTVTSSPPGGVDANAGSTALTHTINSLTNGVAYTFTVTATNAIGTSAPSLPSNSVTPNSNVAPAITSANATTFTVGTFGSFTVTTTGSPTPAISRTGALPAGVTFVDNGNGTATLSGTATAAGSYPLTITASNGVPLNATQAFTLTVNAIAPGPPTGVTASAGNAGATVTFSAPASDGGSPITGYTVTSIPAGGVDTNAGSLATTHVITGLINGTSYTFTVKATNAAGTSVASAPSNSVTPTASLGDSSNLVFKPLEPCRIMDTRSATAGSGVQGPIAGNSLKSVPGFITAGSNWGIYGGSASGDCGLTNPPGASIKALATVITILNPNFDAYLGVGDANDLTTTLSTIALNYTHGQGLSTMYIVPQIVNNNIYFAMPAGLSAQLIIDVVGYYVRTDATALQCTSVSSAATTIGAGTFGTATSPACTSGYALTSGNCHSDLAGMKLVADKSAGQTWTCSANNTGGSQGHLTATVNCCRVPGK